MQFFLLLDNSESDCVVQAVIVNLRIDSEETRLLGTAGHIAEVQLVLDAFIDTQACPCPLLRQRG